MKNQDNKDAPFSPSGAAAERSNSGATRRDLFRASAVLAGGIASAAAGLVAQPAEAIAEVTANGAKLKVIDFRCRPPLKPYGGLFNLRLNFLAKRPTVLGNPATSSTVPASVSMVGQPGAIEQWWKELDAAGIDVAVSNGRYAAGDPTMSMDSSTLADLQKQYSGRFVGLAATNLDQSIEKTVSDLEHAIKTDGLRGANLEPGYRTKNGGATTIDNADFYPIFETMTALDSPLMVQTGAFAGLESFGPNNDMSLFDAVKVKFPKLKIVLAHGGYPSILDALALALKHPNVFICPDCYMFWPGGQLYQQNLDLLPDQFIYGSAYPFGNVDITIAQTLKLPVSETTMRKYLHDNAATLLKL
jgi:predicted TIM-barrel fold metal-dependent hydrolase